MAARRDCLLSVVHALRSSQALAAKNPIATTLVFEHLIENIRANLFGLSPDRKKNYPLDDARRTTGIFGVNTGSRDVKECNKRASMHEHGQTHGGVRRREQSRARAACRRCTSPPRRRIASDHIVRNALRDPQVWGELYRWV